MKTHTLGFNKNAQAGARPAAFTDGLRPQLFRALSLLRRRWLPIAVVSMAAIVTLVVSGQTSPPNIPPINLSTNPLFAAAGGDKPVIALALSVEFPTVGAQYLPSGSATTDNTYANTNEYLGYYDAEACYTYNNAPTETPASGLTATDYKRFDRSGAATSRMCTNAFSGNFLNWASSSAIDMLRLALSGGDRYIDTASQTILQRAVIPNGNPVCMWNSSNFPAKQLSKNGGGTGNYWGAVPTAMITQANGSDIWVGNTLNRIYFGTSKTGGCGNTGAYVLGGPATSTSIGPIVYSSSTLPGDAVVCASENGSCSFSGVKEVWYGFNRQWYVAPASGGVSCSNAVFGDPYPGQVKQCYTRPYSGSWTPTASASASALNSDGFFYARIQVCNVSGTTLQDSRDYGLCKQYPNGNYKPTGSIQKYSDQLRLSAFGYLMDPTQSALGGRYGGVLRAPMKFVGAKTFDITGLDNTPTGGNPNSEWNASTGVFAANPDGDATQATPISGVINYLNKFGRTGAVAGRYKTYDPVGELHYEVLRYLQGLQPSAAAVSSITSDMYDGFPVSTTWVDPYGGGRSSTADYSCLKSNIVTIGDIHTWDGNRLPTPSAANNIPDINYWRSIVQSFEKNQTTSYLDGQGVTQTTANPNGANNNVPSNTSTSQIMGSSYWGHTYDIRGTSWTGSPSQQRPGLRTKSFFFDVNEYGESSVAANRQYSNQFFTAAKYGGFESDPANLGKNPYNTFGNPFKQQNGTDNNNVWQDPANPGEASTYYLQSSARAVLSAFDSIFSRSASSARSIAGSAASSKNLTQSGSTVYQAAFDTSDWSGDVLSLPITVSTSNVVSIGTTPSWTAATRLSALGSPATVRNIVVGRPGAIATPTASAFTWAAIDTAMQTNLSKLTPTSTGDTMGQDRLNYLRGDQSKQGNPFRARTKLLGDIVNSGIVYSGAPTVNVGGSNTYGAFYTANAGRTAALFVGANDGMMHAFNAATGDELFGYIPSWMGPKLAALTNPSYNSSHQNYVDATAAVAEAQVGSAGTSADWKTVLVSGTGGGGAGVFALDVTDPTAFSASKVMWEFTHADDADLGYVVGRPKIVKLRTSAPGASAPTYRWFAMVASGVNNYVIDNAFGGTYSTTGQPALFLLALDKAAGAAWNATGTSPNYYKISLPINSTLSTTNATGLLNFSTALGNALEVTQVYMGDLHGNLWKLDFSLHGATEWNMNKLTAYNKGTAASPAPYPLYVAKTGASTPVIQPISMAPSVISGPVVGGLKTAYIAFGTGKYLEVSDKTSTAQNSFYEIYDDGTSTADSAPVGASIISSRGRLQAGSINTTTGVVSVSPFNWGRSGSDADTTQRSGWYVDFGSSGERLINNAVVAGNNLTFGSLIPASSGTTGSCSASGGSGLVYTINVDTGIGSSLVSTVGLLGEPLVLNISSATINGTPDTSGRRATTTFQQVVQQGSSGVNTGNTATTTTPAGRLSWRQINNYQDLKNTP